MAEHAQRRARRLAADGDERGRAARAAQVAHGLAVHDRAERVDVVHLRTASHRARGRRRSGKARGRGPLPPPLPSRAATAFLPSFEVRLPSPSPSPRPRHPASASLRPSSAWHAPDRLPPSSPPPLRTCSRLRSGRGSSSTTLSSPASKAALVHRGESSSSPTPWNW